MYVHLEEAWHQTSLLEEDGSEVGQKTREGVYLWMPKGLFTAQKELQVESVF